MNSDSHEKTSQLPSGRDFAATRLGSECAPHEKPNNGRDSNSVDDKNEPLFHENDKVGRYVIVRELGSGGFGHVYLARDPKLERNVAIKYPRLERGDAPKAIFLEEGRSVARLDHPSIVRIYNIEETDDGNPFVVMEYVEGPTLRTVIHEKGLTFSTSLDYLIQIAEALAYAHGQTLIHRDLKPANVIVTADGLNAKLMDFGMAIHDLTPDERLPTRPEGTPAYMSPEQVRGEGHRLDGRTDIWAFGVLTYVMLTGQKPFRAEQMAELIREICLKEPKPPRRINPSVPEELERICLKCLEKLMSSRFQSTRELVEDLKSFHETWHVKIESDLTITSQGIVPQLISKSVQSDSEIDMSRSISGVTNSADTTTTAVKVVPKGLRSFDGQDAEFFVDLLPGPKDRNGVPESLRFWINKFSRISDEPLSVGLIFGPSGCGKSSFVKAGLIPHLQGVTTIYVEASAHDTENRILEKIKHVAPRVVREEDNLNKVFNRLRRGQSLTGEKMLIVIDQFEQWLHSNPELIDQNLIVALRQCDGGNLSCILMVRDDFWMSATQFMAQLDLKVQEGVNALGIPLFDRKHARRVLTAYGQANEAFENELTKEQTRFVSSAVAEMSNNGRVIPIHLALFSQMMDSDSWETNQLKKMGGWKGLGVHFLESIFSHKRSENYETACRSILQQLLPDVGSKIKGAKTSLLQLQESTGIDSPDELQAALDLLDRESRIITPTESESSAPAGQHYQLAHDYLVEPIRQWLSQKEQQTRQGRARLRLAELTSQWEAKPEVRYLPSPLEYAAIRTSIDKKTCAPAQRKLLKTTGRYYAIRLGLIGLLIAVSGMLAGAAWKSANRRSAIEKFNSLLIGSPEEVEVRLQMLAQSNPADVLGILNQPHDFPSPRAKLHSLFVASRFEDPANLDYLGLLGAVASAEAAECKNIVRALSPLTGTPGGPKLHKAIETKFHESDSDVEKFRLAVIAMQLGSPGLAGELLTYQLDPELRLQFIEQYADWHGALPATIECLKVSTDPSFQSGMCLSMGRIPRNEISDADFESLSDLLNERMRNALTPDVHSSARWALENLGVEIAKLDRLRSPDSSWFVKNFGRNEQATFVRVEPHLVYKGYGLDERYHQRFRSKPEPIELENSFHISAREVRASLFYEFVNSLEPDDPVRLRFDQPSKKRVDEDLPIADVKWIEAARFCNWLSEREGLRACYAETDEEIGELNGGKYKWELVPFSNGYRLPTSFEWEAACRAGNNTTYSFGNKLSRVSQFAVTGVDPFLDDEIGVAARGQKMPNRFGLFDTTGNASEWCQDSLDHDTANRFLRGGFSNSGSIYFQCSSWELETIHSIPVQRYAGIRLVIEID